jgi:AcrR family transcriptional regulator
MFGIRISGSPMRTHLAPRKTPVQSRSNATVNAIFEATIQVLLKVGHARFSTTLVSERAGVSVGTLYQYFPHKEALMAAVIGHYIEAIGAHVRVACEHHHAQPLKKLVKALVGALVEAKTRRIDVSQALHGPMAALDGDHLVAVELARTSRSVELMLETCTDRSFQDIHTTVNVLLSALLSATQVQIEKSNQMTPEKRGAVERHLQALAYGYLRAVGGVPRAR